MDVRIGTGVVRAASLWSQAVETYLPSLHPLFINDDVAVVPSRDRAR